MRNYGWFRLAHELRMSLRKCMEEHTERQMLLWMRWFDEDLNRPGKTENYLMSVACEVRRVAPAMFGGKPNEIQPKDLQLKFETVERVTPTTKETVAGIAKSVWTAGLGEVTHKRISRAEARERGMIE